jgi:hypothetical protein
MFAFQYFELLAEIIAARNLQGAVMIALFKLLFTTRKSSIPRLDVEVITGSRPLAQYVQARIVVRVGCAY